MSSPSLRRTPGCPIPADALCAVPGEGWTKAANRQERESLSIGVPRRSIPGYPKSRRPELAHALNGGGLHPGGSEALPGALLGQCPGRSPHTILLSAGIPVFGLILWR